MIPNNLWSSDKTKKDYASYGMGAKPFYQSKNPYFITIAVEDALLSLNGITYNWWLFEFDNGVFKLYLYDDNQWQYQSDLFTAASCIEFSATFDQLGRPIVFNNTGTKLVLWWFDPTLASNTITEFGEGSQPFASFDLKYKLDSDSSDVLLFYLRNGAVYYRQQRDRYDVEYTTPITPYISNLLYADMAQDYRMQVEYRYQDDSYVPPTPIPPIVVPQIGYWSYNLSGMGSYINTGRNVVDPVLDKDYEIIVDIDSVYLDNYPSEVVIFAQNMNPEPGLYGAGLICSIAGKDHDVLILVLAGVLNQFKLPWSLSAGLWSFEFAAGIAGARQFRVNTTFDGDPIVYHSEWFTCLAGSSKESASGFVFGGANYRYGNYNKCFQGVIKEATIKHYRFDKDLIIKINDKQSGEYQKGYNNEGNVILTTINILDYRPSNWVFNE